MAVTDSSVPTILNEVDAYSAQFGRLNLECHPISLTPWYHKLVVRTVLIIASICIVPDGYGFAAEMKKEETSVQGKKYIRLSMTLKEFDNLNCTDFVPFLKKMKHKISDDRLREYYHFKPLLSVVMREVDINSYFEIVFEKDKITEINQYALQGKLIKRHTKICCWI